MPGSSKYTMPLATAGEEEINEPTRVLHNVEPVLAFNALMAIPEPSLDPTNATPFAMAAGEPPSLYIHLRTRLCTFLTSRVFSHGFHRLMLVRWNSVQLLLHSPARC